MKTIPSMEKIFTYARKIYTKKLEKGKNLLELTTYNNISMWWLSNSMFRVFLNKVVIGKIDDKKYRRKFILFYKSFGIYLAFIYDLFLELLLRIIIQITSQKKNSKDKFETKKIMFFTPEVTWRVIKDYKTNKMKKTDSFFDTILETSNMEYIAIGVNVIDLDPIEGLKVFIDKIKNWHIPYRPANIYWSFNVWKKRIQAFKYFSNIWKYLKKDKIFREICIIEEKNFYPQIKDELDFYFYFLYPHAVGYIEMGRNMIRSEKTNLIVLFDEYEFKEKSFLVIAAKLENIPTLALEHAIIFPAHEGYMYEKGEISPIGGIYSPYYQITDKTAVYGEYYKELLTKISVYPENSVEVTGQPRYDVLAYVDKIYSKKNFITKYKIPNNHRIILWLTQSHGASEDENNNNFKTVFETMKHIKNATLVIKQHPAEGEIYIKMIQANLKKYNINAVLVPKKSDTYELLFDSDIIITKDSTSGIEALALNKPLIVLNLSGKPDLADYVTEGVALGVYQPKDLQTTIETILKDDSMLVKNRKKYVEKNLYKIDGKATERVINVINNLVRSS